MKTAAFVLAMALPLAAQDKARTEVEGKLSNLKVSLDFKDAPLEAVVDYIREISDLNIVIDQKVAEKKATVTIKVTEISLRSVFNLMLQAHGADILYKEGVLQILLKEDIIDRTLKMEIYDCRDILYPIQDFPGVDIKLADIGVLAEDTAVSEPTEMPIEELVKAHTGAKTWDTNPKVSCMMQNGLLIVKQTPEVHRQIVRLLNMLRRHK